MIIDKVKKINGAEERKNKIGGIATLNEMPITVIGEQKGKNVKENMERNFGMPE